MNKFMIHIMIYIMSVVSYIYLNNINISPLSMCSLFIKFICCNKSLKDSDVVSQPESLTVPFEEIKKLVILLKVLLKMLSCQKIK